ncbi:hypothetical protein EVAR_98266_1 [Eumeta japonica]|uniref:Uncharacterized protein n=1 Tax=Eumeta variegata TaxID=151549 RepID=A0A4C2A2N2_EUMVA|nr:hypothetical protein EVAR_98266_1 [Eumeta japonica]
MQAARHRGHYGRAERVGTAAPALPDSGHPTRRAPRWAGRLPGHRGNNCNCEPMLRGASSIGRIDPDGAGREEEDTGSLTHAWLSRPRPRQPALRNPVLPHPAHAQCALPRPRV